MKTLPPIVPTPEQLPIISGNSLGMEVIRGAAGSGKTSTAILRLRSLAYMFEERNEREAIRFPVQILVLTFNRTLSGYVKELIDQQVAGLGNTFLTVDTFSRWAMNHVGHRNVVDDRPRENKLKALAAPITNLSPDYVVKEVDYLLGRFPPDRLDDYLDAERTGRGAQPRVDRQTRQRILDLVVKPYQAWLVENNTSDWNTLAVDMAASPAPAGFDIAIVDESQDFSANQLRALRAHLADDHAVTFVIDTMQRIYARGFTWSETGFDGRARYYSLRANHRNTAQIAAFASGVLSGLPLEDDGALPDLQRANSQGSLPTALPGKFSGQIAWAIEFIRRFVDLRTESVAFLQPQGGGYFKATREALKQAGIDFTDLTRQPDWPDGAENVALCTFHSAKGLEFDHVFILGLNAENTEHGEEAVDDQLTVLRRLLAVAIARARLSVTVGYKPGEQSDLVAYFQSGTFREEVV